MDTYAQIMLYVCCYNVQVPCNCVSLRNLHFLLTKVGLGVRGMIYVYFVYDAISSLACPREWTINVGGRGILG